MTVKLFTANGRSSSGRGELADGVTSVAVGAATKGAVNTPFTEFGAASFTVVFGSSATNTLPVPSSLIVPTPTTVTLLALVAVRLKVSALSAVVSFAIGVRTNSVPVLSKFKAPLT